MGEDESVSNSSKGAASNASKAPLPVPSLAPAWWWWRWWCWWRWLWWWFLSIWVDETDDDVNGSPLITNTEEFAVLMWEEVSIWHFLVALPLFTVFPHAGCCPGVQSWKNAKEWQWWKLWWSWWWDVADFPAVFFLISHWNLSWKTIDKSKYQESVD